MSRYKVVIQYDTKYLTGCQSTEMVDAVDIFRAVDIATKRVRQYEDAVRIKSLRIELH